MGAPWPIHEATGVTLKRKRYTFSKTKEAENLPGRLLYAVTGRANFIDDIHGLWYTIKQSKESIMGLPGK